MQQPPYQPPDWTQLNKQPVSRQAGSVPPPAQLEPEYQAPQVPGGYAPAQPGYAPQPGPYAQQRQPAGAAPAGAGASQRPGQAPPPYSYPPQGEQPSQPAGPRPLQDGRNSPYQPQPSNKDGRSSPYQAPPPYQGAPEDPFFESPSPASGASKPGYRMPSTGIPVRKRRSGTPYVVIAVIVLAVAAIAAIQHFAPREAMYGYVSAGVLSSRYAGDAVIVRDETVYTQEGVSRIDYTAEEGADVNRTTSVCTVYTSGFNTRELTTLQKYRDQIQTYHKTLITSSGAAKDARLTALDSSVREQARNTRLMIQEGRGSLVNQELLLTQALQARQSYLRQKYPDDQKLSRLYDDENAQLQRISSWTKQFAAAADGIVSFYTDGFEPALNMLTYGNLSPSEVRSMYQGNVPVNTAATRSTVAIYRLVRKDRWAVLMLSDNPDWTPVIGQNYRLLIENFESTVVDAAVESFTRSGGELLVRLSVSGADVRNILYTRSCRVQLGENVDSLTIPTRALYSQMGQTGVVIVDETGNNYFTPVTVISTQGDVTHIIPKNSGYLYEGMIVKLF